MFYNEYDFTIIIDEIELKNYSNCTNGVMIFGLNKYEIKRFKKLLNDFIQYVDYFIYLERNNPVIYCCDEHINEISTILDNIIDMLYDSNDDCNIFYITI